MDRLYSPLASISRGVDHIITLHWLNSLYFLLLLAGMGIVIHLLTSIYRQNAATLARSSDWIEFGDCRFNLLPNGGAEVISTDGLRRLRSLGQLEQLLKKHFKSRGMAFDEETFKSLVKRDTRR
jgi:hypothetical protein